MIADYEQGFAIIMRRIRKFYADAGIRLTKPKLKIVREREEEKYFEGVCQGVRDRGGEKFRPYIKKDKYGQELPCSDPVKLAQNAFWKECRENIVRDLAKIVIGWEEEVKKLEAL